MKLNCMKLTKMSSTLKENMHDNNSNEISSIVRSSQ